MTPNPYGCASILIKLWRVINHLFTYLLTYVLTLEAAQWSSGDASDCAV